MADPDSIAFDYMKEGDPDKYITGGAIEHSEYEMDMSPEEQEDFLRENTRLFNDLYQVDPLADKEKLPFVNWLRALNEDYVMMLSEDYADTEKKSPREPEAIISKDIMAQADKHWGGKHGLDKIRELALGGK